MTAGGGFGMDMMATIGAGYGRLVGAAKAHPVLALALATALVSGVAIAFPGIDLAVAGLFHRNGAGFPAERIGALVVFRRTGMTVTHVVAVGLILAVLAKLLLPMLARAIPMRKLLFLATSMALGPGLVVNSLLKEVFTRARPREIVEHGGALRFVPAWFQGGGCSSNCSFPSGEASAAMWLVAFAFVVPERWRMRVAMAAVVWAFFVSLNRMAFGGHFLSDVLIGWGLVLTIVFACRAFFLETMGPTTERAIDDRFARFGDRLLEAMRLRGFGARTGA